MPATTEQQPPVTIVNLETGEAREAPMVPEELSERLQATRARLKPFGASRAVLQYTGTDNLELPDISLRATAATRAELDAVTDFLDFLRSLFYAPQTGPGSRLGAPPRVLFIWPGTMTVTGYFEKLDVKREQFNRAGNTVRFTATVSFVESSEVEIPQEFVRRGGNRRT